MTLPKIRPSGKTLSLKLTTSAEGAEDVAETISFHFCILLLSGAELTVEGGNLLSSTSCTRPLQGIVCVKPNFLKALSTLIQVTLKLKGVLAKNEPGNRLTLKNYRW